MGSYKAPPRQRRGQRRGEDAIHRLGWSIQVVYEAIGAAARRMLRGRARASAADTLGGAALCARAARSSAVIVRAAPRTGSSLAIRKHLRCCARSRMCVRAPHASTQRCCGCVRGAAQNNARPSLTQPLTHMRTLQNTPGARRQQQWRRRHRWQQRQQQQQRRRRQQRAGLCAGRAARRRQLHPALVRAPRRRRGAALRPRRRRRAAGAARRAAQQQRPVRGPRRRGGRSKATCVRRGCIGWRPPLVRRSHRMPPTPPP